jgi:hypothetical protein
LTTESIFEPHPAQKRHNSGTLLTFVALCVSKIGLPKAVGQAFKVQSHMSSEIWNFNISTPIRPKPLKMRCGFNPTAQFF